MNNKPFGRINFLFVSLGILLVIIGLAGKFQVGLSNYANPVPAGSDSSISNSVVHEPSLMDISQPENRNVRLEFKNGSHRDEMDPVVALNQSVSPKTPERIRPAVPDRIEIPGIGLDAPVVTAKPGQTEVDETIVNLWQVPAFFAGGWHPNSALLGAAGNTVISGHHNAFGEVFGKLVDIQIGDQILVYSGDRQYEYRVSDIMILPDRFKDLATRIENARWISRTDDERLTLVTCWPHTSNTHRLIVIAFPATAQSSVDQIIE